MTLFASTLRPGLLVSLSTSVKGNTRYQKIDLENEHRTESGEALARWETTRIVADPIEAEAAKKTRSKASSLIRSVCAASAFGLLCPETDADKLDEAITEAHRLVDSFNSTASMTRIRLYVIAGRIAQDDVTAVRAINSEVRELLDDMEKGVRNLDTQTIRDAADKAKQIGQMLTPEAQRRIEVAVLAARDIAKKIVKAGVSAATMIDQNAIRLITAQRTAFLDLSDEIEIAKPQSDARAVEFDNLTPEEDETTEFPASLLQPTPTE